MHIPVSGCRHVTASESREGTRTPDGIATQAVGRRQGCTSPASGGDSPRCWKSRSRRASPRFSFRRAKAICSSSASMSPEAILRRSAGCSEPRPQRPAATHPLRARRRGPEPENANDLHFYEERNAVVQAEPANDYARTRLLCIPRHCDH